MNRRGGVRGPVRASNEPGPRGQDRVSRRAARRPSPPKGGAASRLDAFATNLAPRTVHVSRGRRFHPSLGGTIALSVNEGRTPSSPAGHAEIIPTPPTPDTRRVGSRGTPTTRIQAGASRTSRRLRVRRVLSSRRGDRERTDTRDHYLSWNILPSHALNFLPPGKKCEPVRTPIENQIGIASPPGSKVARNLGNDPRPPRPERGPGRSPAP